MNKIQPYLPILTAIAAVVPFLIGMKESDDLATALPMFALSIILFVSSGTQKISIILEQIIKQLSDKEK